MRKIFYTISIIAISSVIYSACSKAVEGRTDNIPALTLFHKTLMPAHGN
jgi:hypothetical protein